jgi:hypothetical protein
MVKRQTLYTLRVELFNIEPLIWRRIQIEGKVRLTALHHVIQAAFGSSEAHPHEFDVGGRLYGNMKQVDTELREDGWTNENKRFPWLPLRLARPSATHTISAMAGSTE